MKTRIFVSPSAEPSSLCKARLNRWRPRTAGWQSLWAACSRQRVISLRPSVRLQCRNKYLLTMGQWMAPAIGMYLWSLALPSRAQMSKRSRGGAPRAWEWHIQALWTWASFFEWKNWVWKIGWVPQNLSKAPGEHHGLIPIPVVGQRLLEITSSRPKTLAWSAVRGIQDDRPVAALVPGGNLSCRATASFATKRNLSLVARSWLLMGWRSMGIARLGWQFPETMVLVGTPRTTQAEHVEKLIRLIKAHCLAPPQTGSDHILLAPTYLGVRQHEVSDGDTHAHTNAQRKIWGWRTGISFAGLNLREVAARSEEHFCRRAGLNAAMMDLVWTGTSTSASSVCCVLA